MNLGRVNALNIQIILTGNVTPCLHRTSSKEGDRILDFLKNKSPLLKLLIIYLGIRAQLSSDLRTCYSTYSSEQLILFCGQAEQLTYCTPDWDSLTELQLSSGRLVDTPTDIETHPWI